tara:strand:+ start:579 stop:815 length:237 start_codon:yes stop_codon:yes gene_type:complete
MNDSDTIIETYANNINIFLTNLTKVGNEIVYNITSDLPKEEDIPWVAIVFCAVMIACCLAGCYCIPKCGHKPPVVIPV